MSTVQGGQGNIVTSGLVLNLDAANPRSYLPPYNGTTWFNLASSSNNGTLTNGPTFNTGSGGNIVFDGVDDYASLGTFTGLGSTNRTIEVWFQILSLSPSGNRRVIAFPQDDTNNDTPAYTVGYATTTSSLQIGFGGTPYNGYIANISFTLSTWICLVGVISSNTLTGYLNNTFINSATNSGVVTSNPIGYLGRYNGFYSQNGNLRIGSTRIYNRALLASEINQNFQATRARFGI